MMPCLWLDTDDVEPKAVTIAKRLLLLFGLLFAGAIGFILILMGIFALGEA